MLITIFPTGMFANETLTAGSAGDGSISTQSENVARADSVKTYTANADNYEAVVEQIKTEQTAGSTVTIELSGDLGIKALSTYVPAEIGIEGYTVIYTSAEGGPYCIFAKSNYSQAAVGDVVFDNVWLALSQHQGREQGTVSSFYAKGHTVEFTENFRQAIANLYGGDDGATVSSTHLILNGDLIADDEKPDTTAQNWRVYGGGHYKENAKKDGKVSGDVVIDIGPHARIAGVVGGGYNSSVGGNITINMNGDASDPKHRVGVITGGGFVSDKGPDNGRYSGTVAGNINLNLISGKFSGLSYGGGQYSSGGGDGEAAEDVQSLNDKNQGYDYLFYGTVGGNVNITFGKEGAADDTCSDSSSAGVINLGGSAYSVIQGDVNIVINDGTTLTGGIGGMGRNDIVEGAVNITMNGGDIEGIWGMGETWHTSYGNHEIGRSDDEDVNYYYPKNALTITVNDGEVSSVAWFEQFWKSTGTVNVKDAQIYGNVLLNINGGTITQIYMNNPQEANLEDVDFNRNWKLTYVRGDKGLETHIKGGTFTGNPSIYAQSLSRIYMGQRIYFENDEPIEMYHIYGADAKNNEDYNGGTADIIVNNNAPASIRFYQSSGGTEYPALKECGSVDIQKGTLALAGENTISGDFTISENGTLALPAKNDSEGYANGVLNVEGTAEIAANDGGWLKVVEATPYKWSSGSYRITASNTEQNPTVGDVYLRAKTTNETASAESDANLLDLQNTEAVKKGLYVEYTKDSTATTTNYNHAWRIAQGTPPAPEEYHVIYAFTSGTRGASLPDEVTDLLPVDSKTYAVGETVTAIQPDSTRVEIENSGDKDVWIFQGYDKTTQTVSEEILNEDDDIEFNGTWELFKEVTFDANYEGADPEIVATKDVEKGKSIGTDNFPENPSREGYTFTGWNTAEDGNGTNFTDSSKVSKSLTVYAQWEKNATECTVTFDKNDGVSIEPHDTVTVEENTAVGDEMPTDPTRDGYTFTGWNTEKDGSGTEFKADTKVTENINVYAQWECEKSIAVKPADITIYRGGEEGHDGVVNVDKETGEVEVVSSDSLPEPGFLVTLPESLNDKNVTAFTFKEKDGDRTWTFKSYDGKSTEVYRLVPAEGQTATRVTFTDGEGNTVVSDEFDVGAAVNTTFTMALYKGEGAAAVGDIVVKDGGTTYPVDSSNTGTLTVRGTTDQAQLATVKTAITPEKGKAAVEAVADTTYSINGGDVEVADPDGVALLYDAIIDHSGENRTALLQKRAESYLAEKEQAPADGNKYAYSFQYMDLVDANNGNAWVKASNAVTVYWPLPEGTTKDTKFTLLHFKDLDRDMFSNQVADKIASSELETLKIKGVTDSHVVFEVQPGEFSPFALVWEEQTTTPAPTEVTVTFKPGDHGDLIGADADGNVSATVASGDNLTDAQIPDVDADHGYYFTGWLGSDGKTYSDEDLLELTITSDMTFTAQYEKKHIPTPPPVGPGDDDDDGDDNEPPILNTQDHFSYVVGYAEDYRTGQPTDNEDLWPVKPQNNITRAEVASIFYRLLKEDVRDENTTDVSNFSDVSSSDWYGTTVATLADMGIVKGYEDGTFRPNEPITRAEFAAIATRFFEETGATYEPGTFTDVTGDEWFAGAIMDAVNLGLIGGYEDDTVRPNNNITRAEACAIVNRTLGRVPDADHLLPEDEMKTWPDNPESAWFYADMQEATNGHEYEWITEDGNRVENWTDLLDKDWNDRSVN